jgi:hypothetical protein
MGASHGQHWALPNALASAPELSRSSTGWGAAPARARYQSRLFQASTGNGGAGGRCEVRVERAMRPLSRAAAGCSLASAARGLPLLGAHPAHSICVHSQSLAVLTARRGVQCVAERSYTRIAMGHEGPSEGFQAPIRASHGLSLALRPGNSRVTSPFRARWRARVASAAQGDVAGRSRALSRHGDPTASTHLLRASYTMVRAFARSIPQKEADFSVEPSSRGHG